MQSLDGRCVSGGLGVHLVTSQGTHALVVASRDNNYLIVTYH